MVAITSSFSVAPTVPRAALHPPGPNAAPSDAVLVRRFQAGDQAAFVEIVLRYREKMRAVAHTLLHNHADAEEIAQDTFIRAHRSLALFRGDASLSTWLHCITLNLARNRYWYFFRRQRHTTRSLDAPVTADPTVTYADFVACAAPGPVRETAAREFSTLVAGCMTKLNAAEQEILTLRNIRQHTYERIARTLGIKIGTVKSRIRRARVSLRLILARDYPEFQPDESPYLWLEVVATAGRQQAVCA